MQSSLLSPRGPASHALALAIGLASGCGELIELGSECPDHARFCLDGVPESPPPIAPSDTPPTLDAGWPADLRDAAAMRGPSGAGNGSVGATTTNPIDGGISVQLPPLLNRSFELTQGGPGDITAISLPSFTAIAPWYTCQPIGQGSQGAFTAVRAEETLLDEAIPEADPSTPISVTPTDGQTFVSIRYFVDVVQVPLIQRLAAPLEAGRRYGFAVDVRTTSVRTHLALQIAGGNDCLGVIAQPEVLFTTAPVARGAWQRVCISFVPSRTHTLFGLQAVSTEALSNDVLMLDNLREASDCL